MNSAAINNLLEKVEHIPRNRRYWLVRTMGGQYYADYYKRGFVAFGYDKVPYSSINTAKTPDRNNITALAEAVKKVYPDEVRVSYIAKQLIQFAHGIQKGDIVIIPAAIAQADWF